MTRDALPCHNGTCTRFECSSALYLAKQLLTHDFTHQPLLSLSQTLSGWRVATNRAMLLRDGIFAGFRQWFGMPGVTVIVRIALRPCREPGKPRIFKPVRE